MKKRLVYICDWLSPDFGAVGQYAALFARQQAENGRAVTLVGLTNGPPSRQAAQQVGEGTLEVVKVHRPVYNKHQFASRVRWTILSNLALLRTAFGPMWQADAVVFTGSPPLMLHFIAPLNILLRKHLTYRITDFYPECLIAERGRCGLTLRWLLRVTQFWRRRIDNFEVLGTDQARRLMEIGIPKERIQVKRNPSPVTFSAGLTPRRIPKELAPEAGIILYSGNWGVAHDESTFIEAYSAYRRESKQGLALWLNAIGAKADRVEAELRSRRLPVYRSKLVPLEKLPRLLLAADVHLITLRDRFVGYVVPSKVHACIESGKRVLFVGSEGSDVHLLASGALPADRYSRVDVGDIEGLLASLHAIERAVLAERGPNVLLRDQIIEQGWTVAH
jgi:hypothetical protein